MNYFVHAEDRIPLDMVLANLHLSAWLKGDADRVWVKTCIRNNGNLEGWKAIAILSRHYLLFPQFMPEV